MISYLLEILDHFIDDEEYLTHEELYSMLTHYAESTGYKYCGNYFQDSWARHTPFREIKELIALLQNSFDSKYNDDKQSIDEEIDEWKKLEIDIKKIIKNLEKISY